MKIIVTSDLHLDDNPLNTYRHTFMRRLPSIVKKISPDKIIILGDLTTEKNNHDAWLVNAVSDHLAALCQIAPVIIMKGNHDYTMASMPFFKFVAHFGITWINEPMSLSFDARYKYLFLPHTYNYKKDWIDKGALKTTPEMIFAHNTFAGAVGSNGMKLDGIPLSIFKKNARIVSGDIHVPQTLENLTYVGAPYTVDFGDDYSPRLLIITDDRLSSLSINGPQKRLIEWRSIEDRKRQHDIFKGDILKIRLHIKADQYAKLAEYKQIAEVWATEHNCILHTLIPVTDQIVKPKPSSKADTKTDEQILKDYSNANGLDMPTTKMGENLLRKA